MNWIEVTTEATDEAIDWIRTLLASINYSDAIQITEHPTLTANEPASAHMFKLQLYLPDEPQSRTKVNQIRQVLSPLQRTGMITEIWTAIVNELPASGWAPHQVGQFVILPSDAAHYPVAPTEMVLTVEPSLAFGSGFHPATVLSLKLLERFVTPGMNTLDLGCGSGILSLAMARLGATVTAIDNDPIAIAATRRAIYQNQLAQFVTTLVGSLGDGSQLGHWMGEPLSHEVQVIQPNNNFDLIVANLFARIHLSLIDDYRKALRQDSDQAGFLITAGYDVDYDQEISQTFAQAGFDLLDIAQTGTWIAHIHQLHC